MSVRAVAAGFVVSFVGSLPMGYLNVAAWKIFSSEGLVPALSFLTGIVLVEGMLVYLISRSVSRIPGGFTTRMGWISVGFLLALAFAFYGFGDKIDHVGEINFLAGNFLLTGIVLSAANIMQVPFWTGWCLYLSQSGSIERTNDRVVLAVSAAAGTFAGMLLVVLALESLAERFHWFSGFLVTAVMPAIFVLMAGLQVLKLLRKKQ